MIKLKLQEVIDKDQYKFGDPVLLRSKKSGKCIAAIILYVEEFRMCLMAAGENESYKQTKEAKHIWVNIDEFKETTEILKLVPEEEPDQNEGSVDSNENK